MGPEMTQSRTRAARSRAKSTPRAAQSALRAAKSGPEKLKEGLQMFEGATKKRSTKGNSKTIPLLHNEKSHTLTRSMSWNNGTSS